MWTAERSAPGASSDSLTQMEYSPSPATPTGC